MQSQLPQTLAHPAADQLMAFGQGKLAEAESLLVERHLEDCPLCCETLLDLKDDTFVGLVKRAPLSELDRRIGTPARPLDALSDTESDGRYADEIQTEQHQTGMSAHPTSAATLLLPTGQVEGLARLPVELLEHPRYEVRELIGRGGMGNVYRAEHRLMHRPVAIKVINAELVRHPQAVERFRREVQAAAKLSHPNIVAAYDAEQAGAIHFLVMEFVEGTDLASLVNERGPMSVSEACDCIQQAAAGLQHAHEKGMVHRDIKPQNLMLTDQGQVRILDFGLAGFASETAVDDESFNRKPQACVVRESDAGTDSARACGVRLNECAQLTTMGSVMGTPDYMAPEQAVDAHAADIRADLYSLGCTLFFLLTGKPVFETKSVVAKLTAHAKDTPPALSTLRPDVSVELQRVVSRLLAKQPEDRFQTPQEVVAALEPLTRSRVQKSQRLGLLIATVCCGLAVLLGGLIVLVTNKGRLEIRSEVDDVKIVVKQGGEQVDVIDLKTGSQMKWLPNGDYELQVVGRDNDVKLDRTGFSMSRFGQAIVTARWNSEALKVVRAFTTNDKPISHDDVTVDDGGWKLTSKATRTVRLFEVPNPKFAPGPFFFRAKLKTENVVGRTYLAMWNRFPGKGEFFSKGLHNAVSGTNGWAEYEIPFFLKAGEEPDLVKLNVVIEGTGSVWIKDVEVRGRQFADAATMQAANGTGGGAKEIGMESQSTGSGRSPNLLTDPSFEDTALTQLPKGWRAWLNDGQEFQCAVVPGGHTGQRCLKISGKGTRGVVFANDMQADRSKRYALKGWAKFEGDASARALIKFNYFKGSEFLGVHDLIGATSEQAGWQLFEKTDALEMYPTADHFYVMCHVEGSGTGWFDDLELVAYDRDKLPADFDTRHGRHNRMSGANSLNRWVGTWDTEYSFREADNSPTETKRAMTTTAERTLGDYYLWSYSQAKSPHSDERLQFLVFDQSLGAFRQWIFNSNGKVMEFRGPWNEATQTLELRMLPDASNLHASEHFVDAEHIEAKLHFQYVMGQRDAGRWKATRTAATAKVDVPVVKTPLLEQNKQSQLDKFVGEWTILAKYKQSVWNPQPREETASETSVWILGGRFLMTKSFNEHGKLTAIWLATYDPTEKTNRFGFFNADGSSSESRLTWDAAASGFQFRAIDMPNGWTSTGFNHWVDADSFDNTALIKDEKGRVLLDMSQERRRKK